MGDTEIVATEDALQALIDHLVYPLLPIRASLLDSPSISQQQCVAKQMHAVVLLYNYYHRKQYPELEFLGFESFCKVAVNARPSLLMHMKFMQRCNEKSGNLDKQLSITEEMVMEACNICTQLDASRDAPDIEGWRVSKVVILVVDSMKRNCLLQFSSMVQGVWSLVEKNLDVPYHNLEGASEMLGTNKKNRVTKRLCGDESDAGEAALQQIAFLAVKEVTGIDQTDLTILERHFVYSLSKEKSTARFYLMQCNKPINEEVIQVPIKDAISSLQGPLVRKSVDTCVATSVVEYFHLLPYVSVVSDWFSREIYTGSSQLSPGCPRNVGENCSLIIGMPCTMEGDDTGDRSDCYGQTTDIPENETDRIKCEIVYKEENDGNHMKESVGAVCMPKKMSDDSSLICHGQPPPSEDAAKIAKNIQDTHVEKRKKPLIQNGSKATGNGLRDKVERVVSSKKPCATEKIGVKVKSGDDVCRNGSLVPHGVTAGGRPQGSLVRSPLDPDKAPAVLASKGNELLETALRALQKKQDELCHQHRQLADEIAQCEKKIQTIMGGGEDGFMLEIESIIEACNAASSKVGSQTRHSHHVKRKRLSEAILILRSPCQELDEICSENNWILPRYSVSPSSGGFLASVTIQGMDFECSGCGDVRSNPREARESAATDMMSKLRSMASQLQ
ncbi:uncharacterized protein LOC131240108 [Magnolia sinica]|uniref:uncharacterized protein LOC131240108 n=1 Tax=Magnolia sinica TaxID=86752 RepID=UPI00265845C0|nr:uncharacterized protein LOC131240108 [Magnolia sinica]